MRRTLVTRAAGLPTSAPLGELKVRSTSSESAGSRRPVGKTLECQSMVGDCNTDPGRRI